MLCRNYYQAIHYLIQKGLYSGTFLFAQTINISCHLSMNFQIHSADVTCVVRDRHYIFTGSKDKTIKVWNTALKQVCFHASKVVTFVIFIHSELEFYSTINTHKIWREEVIQILQTCNRLPLRSIAVYSKPLIARPLIALYHE